MEKEPKLEIEHIENMEQFIDIYDLSSRSQEDLDLEQLKTEAKDKFEKLISETESTYADFINNAGVDLIKFLDFAKDDWEKLSNEVSDDGYAFHEISFDKLGQYLEEYPDPELAQSFIDNIFKKIRAPFKFSGQGKIGNSVNIMFLQAHSRWGDGAYEFIKNVSIDPENKTYLMRTEEK